MSDSLRAEVDRIIDQHFEPSVMGRTLAVDEIMAAFEAAAAKPKPGQGVIGTHTMGQMTINVTTPPPGVSPAVLVEGVREQLSRVGRRRSRTW